jgi:hypothetical protein
MLDVPAPHQSVHTWKDFFVHIATISVGLIIAISEQTVEYVHHLHQRLSRYRGGSLLRALAGGRPRMEDWWLMSRLRWTLGYEEAISRGARNVDQSVHRLIRRLWGSPGLGRNRGDACMTAERQHML